MIITLNKMRYILLILMFNYSFSFGQQINCSIPKEYITDSIIEGQNIKYLKKDIKEVKFCVVEKSAKFQGGDIFKFREWVMKNIDYNNFSSDSIIGGKLNFLFTINSSGKMSDLIISKGINNKIDKEVYRVISSSPDWTAAKQGQKKICQLFGLLIRIQDQ